MRLFKHFKHVLILLSSILLNVILYNRSLTHVDHNYEILPFKQSVDDFITFYNFNGIKTCFIDNLTVLKENKNDNMFNENNKKCLIMFNF